MGQKVKSKVIIQQNLYGVGHLLQLPKHRRAVVFPTMKNMFLSIQRGLRRKRPKSAAEIEQWDAAWMEALLTKRTGSPFPHPNYRFTFIVGASGSGTTLLSRILSHPVHVVCLGGMYWTVQEDHAEAWKLMKLFNRAITKMWDRKSSVEQHGQAKQVLPCLLDEFLSQPEYADRTHVVYKRSAPFNPGDRYRPDLSDLFDIFPNVRVVVIYRDPCAATYSSLRRGFAENLRQCAVICEEQLTYLAAQVRTVPAHTITILPYEPFCQNPQSYAQPLAQFCGFDPNTISQAIAAEKVHSDQTERWKQELPAEDRHFLEQFFNPRRLQQWHELITRN